jgi:hypothetical protein
MAEDKLGRREGLRRVEGGFSAACHPSMTGFGIDRCPFQDVRLNTFWASSENGVPLGLGGPWAVKRRSAFLGEARHARLKSGRQPVLLLRDCSFLKPASEARD